jgi:mannose-6-phosphate isomerase-like protein (cupin superfamily)
MREPLLRGPGEGETVTDRCERFVQIKADLREVAVTDNRYGSGESGPDAHVHREHADCFRVLDGELTFELGDEGERTVAGAGAFVMVPSEVVHTFWNEGPEDARFLNVHAPSKGFADHLRAMRDGNEQGSERFDTFDPPEEGGRSPSEVLVRGPGEGEEIPVGSGGLAFKAGAEELSLTESTLPPRFPGPVLHRHEGFVDSFYVLEGTLGLRLGGEDTVEAKPGTYALVPPGNAHTFFNPTDGFVRMLNLMAPGGFEQYLKEVAAATEPGQAPDPEMMAGIASRYDFQPA